MVMGAPCAGERMLFDDSISVEASICASGEYELLINDVVVADRGTPGKELDFFNVSHWMRAGENRVVLRVRPLLEAPAAFLDGLALDARGVCARFETDGSWEWLDIDAHGQRVLSCGEVRVRRGVVARASCCIAAVECALEERVRGVRGECEGGAVRGDGSAWSAGDRCAA